jgi:eukaryotic-like serine/threonine-protein kinase
MMEQRIDDTGPDEDLPPDPIDDDDRVGEAIEVYMGLMVEGGPTPSFDEFAARYPGLEDDVRAALEGLELVHGLLGMGSAEGSGSGRGGGLDHRIESGRRIAGYRVVRELGRGGMGTVYEAVHVGLDRPVALKVLGIHAAPDSSARRRFLNEARTAAGLHHTHIVPVFDVGQVGGLCYYAMQRIEGSGLDRVLRHLRRTRGAGVRGADGRSGTGNGAHGSRGLSSIHSRLGRLWDQVSSARAKKPATANAENARALPEALLPSSRGLLPVSAAPERSRPLVGDSTASWGSRSRAREAPEAGGGKIALAAVGASLLEAAPTGDVQLGRKDDEPPPFAPQRGQAYFRWVAGVGQQSADALAHAHQQGVIHRDVKPSNLLIDAKGSIWVTDFGLARRLADPGVTHHDSLLGTPRYMSPEQARTGAIDGRTDVYSLGATLYELLTLRPPFDGRTAAELIEQIGQNEPIAPGTIDPRVPRDLETIVLKALAKRPADRYATAAELADDLTRFLNTEPVKARRISLAGRLWRVARRHPGVTSVTTAAAALIMAIATFAYLQVIFQRNEAIAARSKTQVALDGEKAANAKERAARKQNLRSTIELVGLSGTPNRRSHGLELIGEASALEPGAALRRELRDWAVRFLVLREVEAGESELPTGPSRGLVFGAGRDRLAVLSEDDEELAFWDVKRRRRLATLPLRGEASAIQQSVIEARLGESLAARPETAVASGGSGWTSSASRPAASAGSGVPPGRSGLPRQRLAQVGPWLATVLPAGKGIGLIDVLSDTPLRILNHPDHMVMSVLGDSAGRRLVTVEMVVDDSTLRALSEGLPGPDGPQFRSDYRVFLWDLDHLDRPIALDWRSGSGPGSGRGGPLTAISPDGKTVAVAQSHGMVVKLYSAVDGSRAKRHEIEPQAELTALALGPNDQLATAGNTAGGVAIRIWDLDNPVFPGRTSPFPTSLTPPSQSYTRLMRFSPQGTLLAIVGSGPIELWDPVAHSLVAVLGMSDQATDLAFAADGKTLAAAGRAGGSVVWTVQDSTARTQLSGFDTSPVSLAFSKDGVLGGTGWNGEIWFWRSGRCPEIDPPSLSPATTVPSVTTTVSAAPTAEPQRAEPPGQEGDRRAGRPTRGPEGGRPMRGGPMSGPSRLAFDAEDRLVVHDPQGLRIWAAGTTVTETTPAYKIAPPQRSGGGGPWRMISMAKTPDGRTMVLMRASSIFLWHDDAPERLIPINLPARSRAETGTPSGKNAPRSAGGSAAYSVSQLGAVQVAPRGDRIYMIEQRPGAAGNLRAWSIETSADATVAEAHDLGLSAALPEGATNLALSPDGNLLAAGDRTGAVTLVDAASFRILGRIEPPTGETDSFWQAVAFSPDSGYLAVGSQQGTISLWSVAQPSHPSLFVHLPGHRGRVTNLVFDPEGRRLASGGTDALVEVWDLEAIQHEFSRLKLVD